MKVFKHTVPKKTRNNTLKIKRVEADEEIKKTKSSFSGYSRKQGMLSLHNKIVMFVNNQQFENLKGFAVHKSYISNKFKRVVSEHKPFCTPKGMNMNIAPIIFWMRPCLSPSLEEKENCCRRLHVVW